MSDSDGDVDSSKLKETLRRQRSAFKGQLTQFRNRLSAIETIGSLESNIRRLQLTYDKYHQVQLKLEILDDSASADRLSFEEDYEYVESTLLDKLHKVKRLENLPKEPIVFESSANSTQVEQMIPSMSIKLPELKLPTFSGIESEWLAFRDVFLDLIHRKSNIENTVKFVYLKSHIRSGKAFSLIESLPVTADNYDVAWKTLCDRYNNDILIQRAHMRELYNIKSPLENSPNSLQAFIDHSVKNYNALKSLHVPVDVWDLMLIHHLTEQLDNSSKIHVIKNSESTKLLNFEKFITLLRNRVRVQEAIKGTPSTGKYTVDSKKFNFSKKQSSSLVSNSPHCIYCKGSHLISNCTDFSDSKVTPEMRFQFIRNHRLCTNCLVGNHTVTSCDKLPCKICSQKHNSLLHFGKIPYFKGNKQFPNNISTSVMQSSTESPRQDNAHSSVTQLSGISSCESNQNKSERPSCSSKINQILIGTALISVTSESNKQLFCRAMLDSGSHLNFVTENIVNLLQLKRHPTNKIISGIGGKETEIKTKVPLLISSRVSDFSTVLEFHIIPRITNYLPLNPVTIDLNLIPAKIELADPYFSVPNAIDILIGAEIYNELFTERASVTIFKDLPPFYPSVFGYIVSGKVMCYTKREPPNSTALCTFETLHNNIKRFWELETISLENKFSLEEKYCEQHYSQNHKRLPSGRYSVTLPLNENIHQLGSSNYSALMQFYAIERKLIRQPDVYRLYQAFMNEYLSLGHMELVHNQYNITNSYSKAFYFPHHFVIKDSSTTTQLRVVFNGSSKSSSKLSLNDCLYKGPTIQQDLLSIVLRFRKHIVAFTADIAKMYRQILIDPNNQDLQRIWWRSDFSEPVKCYKLSTVTYGTKSAPYLATRTLHQLALDENISFPSASKVLSSDFYVDDCLTGSDSIENAVKLKSELIQLLEKGGFILRKFSSNIPLISSTSDSSSNVSLVLGLSWNIVKDDFEIHFTKFSLTTPCTKRNVLSEICQLFDPLGLCAPMIFMAKMIMQKIWTLGSLDWDDPITPETRDQWINFKSQLINLNKITVPRCILAPKTMSIQIHGFSDASEKGFGCVIYLRVTDETNRNAVNLVCSKSRVAPLKKQTVPRLELCGALLLAQTLSKLVESLKLQYSKIYLWSDSEITLLRIKSEPSKYATFVANRISQIQELSPVQSWCYVPTSQNPADIVSRGVMPKEFLGHELWWSGPSFLSEPLSKWPKNSNSKISSDILSLDIRQTVSSTVCNSSIWDLFLRYSSFTKLCRITAYILRFINNSKAKDELKLTSELTSTELSSSVTRLIKIVQLSEYCNDIQYLEKHAAVPTSSNLKLLSPFLDEMAILRVGGRLSKSNLSYNNKYPIVLPSKHPFTKLIVQFEHNRLLHCGPQTLLYNLRSQYWVIGGRNLCRRVVNDCIPCFRNKPKLSHQIMGELPTDRVTQSRPFSIVGIDFCGPFFAKPSLKSKTKNKIYICLFICFVVKAIHLEIVMNLSSESFLACLRRFISRRGYCIKIYSDNATNFIGCRSELKELRNLFVSERFQCDAKIFCANNRIEWLTIPPRSPHFGGLWESGIKNAKWHMKRVIGGRSLTLEEYHTLICQIEGCLNSRPLTALSSDPNDCSALSPGHFLIGSPILALPEPSLLNLQINRLSRYQLIQMMFQDFWKRWHIEYLNGLQNRYKWQKSSNYSHKIGTLVLLHEENIPPINWILGRIIETHPGSDGRIRVVTIKTSKSIVKRSITKISVLPIDLEYENEN